MPNWAAAPRKSVFGLARSGPKSVSAHEDDQRKSARLDPHHVGQVQQTVAFGDSRAGNVGQNPTETDGHEQQRLELTGNGQVKQHEAHADHDGLTPGELV